MKHRKSVLTALICVTLAGGAFCVVTVAAVVRDPYGPTLRANLPEESSVPPAGSPMSADHHVRMARIVNDLGRSGRWSVEDIGFARELMYVWPDEAIPGEDDLDSFGAYMEWAQAVTIVADRIAWGVPTDEGVEKAFRDTVLAMIAHPQPHVRQSGISHAFGAGMIDGDPKLRQRIERIERSDPDQFVRRMAAIKLAQHDGRPMPLDCPTCPKDENRP